MTMRNILATILMLFCQTANAVTIETFEKSDDVAQRIYLTGVIEGIIAQVVLLDSERGVNPNICVPNDIPVDHNLARSALEHYRKDATEDRDLYVAVVIALALDKHVSMFQ